MNRTIYQATVEHPTDFHNGTHTFTLSRTGDVVEWIDSPKFGMSRPYHTTDDKHALRLFASEHGCSLFDIVKIEN